MLEIDFAQIRLGETDQGVCVLNKFTNFLKKTD